MITLGPLALTPSQFLGVRGFGLRGQELHIPMSLVRGPRSRYSHPLAEQNRTPKTYFSVAPWIQLTGRAAAISLFHPKTYFY